MSYSLIQDTVLKMEKGASPAQDYAVDKDPQKISMCYILLIRILTITQLLMN